MTTRIPREALLAARDKLREHKIPPARCPRCGTRCYVAVDNDGRPIRRVALSARLFPVSKDCPTCGAEGKARQRIK